MKEILDVMVRNLVTNTDEIKIIQTEDENTIKLELQVAKEDMGKIIGKSGKVIRSLRTVIKAAAVETKKRVLVELVE